MYVRWSKCHDIWHLRYLTSQHAHCQNRLANKQILHMCRFLIWIVNCADILGALITPEIHVKCRKIARREKEEKYNRRKWKLFLGVFAQNESAKNNTVSHIHTCMWSSRVVSNREYFRTMNHLQCTSTHQKWNNKFYLLLWGFLKRWNLSIIVSYSTDESLSMYLIYFYQIVVILQNCFQNVCRLLQPILYSICQGQAT